MRTGSVRNTEVFEVGAAVAAVGRNRHINMAESEEQFRRRAKVFLEGDYAGCSDGFVQHVTNLAWDAYSNSRVRLEVSPAALGVLTALTESVPDGPGVAELQNAVAAAAARLYGAKDESPDAAVTDTASADTD